MFNWIQTFFKNSGNQQPEATEKKKNIDYRTPTELAVKQSNTELSEVIRLEAYYLWERDGKPEGKADYYWQQASEVVLHSKQISS